ncbi:MAG: pyrroline-5-carboxylate reductase [Alphaproteobacteria bacterium]|nr:pyrroline-5-carboxylate reductase [Alphaproteobacteria bacterium]
MTLKHVTIIGCGNMGSAMARAWLEGNLIENLHIIKPSQPDADLMGDSRVSYSPEIGSLDTDLVVIGVKPQKIPEIADAVRVNLPERTPVLSMAAGVKLERLQAYFGEKAPIIRCMPNLPASIGKGMTVSVANPHISEDQKANLEPLMSACGEHIWTSKESHMDAVTAVSGGGPAYVFHLIEALTEAAKRAGLPNEMAEMLVRTTLIGSAALVEQRSDITAATLRAQVTSKGGTTAAGLEKLMDGRFSAALTDTVQAATSRSIELSQQTPTAPAGAAIEHLSPAPGS